MGVIKPPRRALLFAGLLTGDVDLLALASRRLRERIGGIEFQSDCWPFDSTDYYRVELGEEITRQFIFFADLVSVERLAEIKRLTNELERDLAELCLAPTGTRPVNIDPGYLTLSKIVLASTKDYSHRIYLHQGIYAEVTLRFESGNWRSWPWTYPDYAADTYHSAFTQARELLKAKLSQD